MSPRFITKSGVVLTKGDIGQDMKVEAIRVTSRWAKGRHRRQTNPLPMLKGDIVIDLTPVDTTYTVIMTNGSGYTTLTLDGTKEACWSLAQQIGLAGGIQTDVIWSPCDIRPANDVIVENDGRFQIIG